MDNAKDPCNREGIEKVYSRIFSRNCNTVKCRHQNFECCQLGDYIFLSFELFVMSIMQEDVYIHCVSAHAPFASLQFDWGHQDG